MGTLLVLIFENEMGAQEMIGHVQSLQRQQLITVSDAAFVILQKNEKVKVKQANSLVGAGTFGGAFWGLLIGQHFWVSQNIDAATNAPANEASDCGIDDCLLKQVNAAIKPGYSALFMMVAYMTKAILTDLAGRCDTILYTTLNSERETKLREAFGIVDET